MCFTENVHFYRTLHSISSMVHAFTCSHIDYCNSLLIGLPKSRFALLRSLLNAAASLIARLPRFCHISSFMTKHLHWLSIAAWSQFKIICLELKVFLSQAPSYICDLIKQPILATSGLPLRPLDHCHLLESRSFIGVKLSWGTSD